MDVLVGVGSLLSSHYILLPRDSHAWLHDKQKGGIKN